MDETLLWVLTSLKQEERTLTCERREELLSSNALSHSSVIFTKLVWPSPRIVGHVLSSSV